MKKIRVLNVIGKRPVGGIGSFVCNYQEHFNDDRLQVDYLIFDDSPTGQFDERVKALGSTVYVLPALKNLRLPSLWKKIDAFMRDVGGSYAIIHLHSVNIAFMCLTSAKKHGVKHLIAHSHATVYSDKPLNAIRNRLLCANLKKQANVYFACSRLAGEFLYGRKSGDTFHVFNNAIECDQFKFSAEKRMRVRQEQGWSGRYVVGHVGRFCKQKNQKYLVSIFAEVVASEPSALLVLIGDGPDKEEVEREVLEKGLASSVVFLGRRDDVDALLQGMDVFVLPSLFEGLPVIGVEAQAAGLSVIASDAITDEMNIASVRFLPLSSPAAWVKAILEHDEPIDRGNAFKTVRDAGFDIKREAGRLERFYIGLVEE